MNYPKKFMKISELEELGIKPQEIKMIYRTRPDLKIAFKAGTAKNSPIKVDTERYERYRQSKCTGR